MNEIIYVPQLPRGQIIRLIIRIYKLIHVSQSNLRVVTLRKHKKTAYVQFQRKKRVLPRRGAERRHWNHCQHSSSSHSWRTYRQSKPLFRTCNQLQALHEELSEDLLGCLIVLLFTMQRDQKNNDNNREICYLEIKSQPSQ